MILRIFGNLQNMCFPEKQKLCWASDLCLNSNSLVGHLSKELLLHIGNQVTLFLN